MKSFSEQLQRLTQNLMPMAFTTLMVLVSVVPVRIPGIGEVMPLFTLVNIYYWSVFCPGVLPYSFLFALGILQDALSGLPLGTSSFINVAFAFLLISQRHTFAKTLFGSVWLSFVVLSAGMLAVQWGIVSLYAGKILPIDDQVFRWSMTCIVYPMLHVWLTHIYQRIYSA